MYNTQMKTLPTILIFAISPDNKLFQGYIVVNQPFLLFIYSSLSMKTNFPSWETIAEMFICNVYFSMDIIGIPFL